MFKINNIRWLGQVGSPCLKFGLSEPPFLNEQICLTASIFFWTCTAYYPPSPPTRIHGRGLPTRVGGIGRPLGVYLQGKSASRGLGRPSACADHPTPQIRKAGGTHPTGTLSLQKCIQLSAKWWTVVAEEGLV